MRGQFGPTALRRHHLWLRFLRAGLRPRLLKLDRAELHCWLGKSDGPPLVLLQGFGASALWQWHVQVRALARRYRLIIPDLVFFGNSRSRRPERSLRFQAEVITELLDRLNIRQCDLMGLSYGGFVAYQISRLWPHRVRKLVLNSSPGPEFFRSDYEALLNRFDLAQLEDLLVPRDPDAVRRLLDIALTRPPWLPRFLLNDTLKQLFANQIGEKRQLITELLSHLDTPRGSHGPLAHETLILWGEHDRVFPLALGRRLHQRLGHRSRLRIVPETAHAPNLERPEEFNRIVLDFLAR